MKMNYGKIAFASLLALAGTGAALYVASNPEKSKKLMGDARNKIVEVAGPAMTSTLDRVRTALAAFGAKRAERVPLRQAA